MIYLTNQSDLPRLHSRMIRWCLTILALIALDGSAQTYEEVFPLRPTIDTPSLHCFDSYWEGSDSKPLIIDTDVDSDDAMAILYLLNAPGIDVRAITTTGTGFLHQAQTVPIALQIAALGGRAGIPVSYGASQAIAPFGGFPEPWIESALDFYSQAEMPNIQSFPNGLSSAQLMVRMIKTACSKVTILGLGPMTNIAAALRLDPAIIRHIDQIVMSAGAFAPHAGNIVEISSTTIFEQTASYRAQAAQVEQTNSAEYNVLLDAAALSIVLQSGAPILISPLNASEHAPVTASALDSLKGAGNASSRFVVGVIQPLLDQGTPAYFWDPVAASLVADPAICTNKVTIPVAVELDPNGNYGTTIETSYGKAVDVCFDIDSGRFLNHFTETIRSAP